MGCGSCGTGTPNGCKSNGGCSSGGCNRMNVFDWLNNLPIDDNSSVCKVVELTFNNGSRKDYYKNNTLHYYSKGDLLTVEGVSGIDVGEVSLSGELVRIQLKKKGVKEFNPEMKKVLRKSTDKDLEAFFQNKKREKHVLARSREIARDLKVQMKLSEVEIQADGKKATFFYTADDRIDFREMIKMFAAEFKVKVEMKQIGIRQEAAKVGGIGSCGRELCCSTWLQDFKSVNTNAARYQNLSINQSKLSGQCGRLKCCLNYELDTYLDALQNFPNNADRLEMERGVASLIKKDIFKNLMWYVLEGGTRHYPLTIQRVKEIKELNSKGIRPAEMEAAEITSSKPKVAELAFVDVVGQISLKSLEKNDRRRRDQNRQQQQNKQQAGGVKPPINNKQLNQPAKNNNNRPENPNNNKQRPENQNNNKQRPQNVTQGKPPIVKEVKPPVVKENPPVPPVENLEKKDPSVPSNSGGGFKKRRR